MKQSYFNIPTSYIMTKKCLVLLFFLINVRIYCSLSKPLLWRWIFPVSLLWLEHTRAGVFSFSTCMQCSSVRWVRGRGQTVALYPNRNQACPVCFPVSVSPRPHMDFWDWTLSHVIFIHICSKKIHGWPCTCIHLICAKKGDLPMTQKISAVT